MNYIQVNIDFSPGGRIMVPGKIESDSPENIQAFINKAKKNIAHKIVSVSVRIDNKPYDMAKLPKEA